LDELDPSVEWIVFCRNGVRSARAVEILLQAGYSRISNLHGGILAWAEEVDTRMFVL
jgi:adenylyltransferase/sulfurtransferase